MVAPADLGGAAARLLTAPAAETGLFHVEGPARYTPDDVAAAFAAALARPVRVEAVPRDAWPAMFRGLGFSATAARSYANMTAAAVDDDYHLPATPIRGTTTLARYIADLVARA